MNAYREFWQSDGEPRAHQALLSEFLKQRSREEMLSIPRAVLARVHEQEVSYNILGAPDGSDRPWLLDELPHVMDPAEFAWLANALTARARLLSACLADLYGPRRLLREGVIPLSAVQGNLHYFRALHGVKPLGGWDLVMYGADVVRDDAGKFLVHSDRTAAPTGAGYALENRLAVGQILAEPFRGYRVRKINRFFERLRRTMAALSPGQGGVPRVVLLTPGLHDESSFEHAYLSRHQGVALVEGRDLTVRGNQVYLKTLEGLQRVDVIWRRVKDDWCDPLELREDSMSGVSGLVSAVRAGTVGIANALGSGLVESPLFRAYLPRISSALFGQPLELPSVPTRHLAEPTQLEEVFDTFSTWIIKPAFDDRRSPATSVGALDESAQEELRQRILEAPSRFVAEQWPVASRVPVGIGLEDEGTLSLRLFACKYGDDYRVMPGGLARVDDAPDGLFLEAERRPISKDLWVPGHEGDDAPALPSMPETTMAIRRGGVDLPSRLFDDLFWLGRYVERCNGTACLVRAGLEPIATEGREILPEVAEGILKTLFMLQIGSSRAPTDFDLERSLLAPIYAADQPNSVRSCLERIHHLTTAVRSRLSRDAWATLRRVSSLCVPEAGREMTAEEAVDQLNELLLALAAVHGISDSNMVRGHAWVFLELGRRIERTVFVLALLQELFPQDGSRILMETILNIADSLLTYRSRYLSTLQAAPVVDLVLTDETNPQSVLFQVRRLLECVRSLPREQHFPLSRAEQRLITLETSLVTADLYKACGGSAGPLRELAEEGINLMWQVSDDLTQSYFAHSGRSRAMAPPHWIGEDLEAL